MQIKATAIWFILLFVSVFASLEIQNETNKSSLQTIGLMKWSLIAYDMCQTEHPLESPGLLQ